MKSIYSVALFSLLALLSGRSATIPIYVNSAPLQAPTLQTPVVPVIDATAWWNRSLFAITNGNFVVAGLPYEAFNNRFFTNTAPTNIFDPGVRFRRNSGGTNTWMDWWVNRGRIITDHDTLSFGVFVSDSRASILQVAASNIVSSGPLFSGTHGLVRLEGNRIDVSRTALRTGSPDLVGFNFSGQFTGVSNYVNDVGIRDLYWGVGRGDAVDNSRSRVMSLLPFAFRPNFNLDSANSVSSTFHEVVSPSVLSGRLQTNTVSIPGGSPFISGGLIYFGTNQVKYHAVANQTVLSLTNSIIQVIFYPSNLSDPEFTTEARFSQFFGGPATATVGFHSREFDIATRTTITNSVYLVDDLPGFTNSFLSRNAATSTRRPNTYAVSRLVPFEYTQGSTGNLAFSTNLFYSPAYTRSTATNRYAAYAVEVDLLSSSPSGSISYNVTNAPGRVEIIGNEVNLNQTRIRAESAVIIKANNLTSNHLAQVDAPLINFDARSVQPVFNVVNLAPQTVRRFGGTVRAWSAMWDNFEAINVGTNVATNTITFHVLIVESQLRSTVPVTVNEFAARATNVVLGDQLNIAKSFVVEGSSLHVAGGGGISLPLGSSLTASNLVNVRNFTNDGIINIPGSAFYGTDRALSYSNWVNRGTNIAASVEVRTRNFDNSGAVVANGGALTIDAVNASMLGSPLIQSNNMEIYRFVDPFTLQIITNFFTNVITLQSAPVLEAVGDVEIRARDLTASNSVIRAGVLLLNVTNRLTDSGTEATNLWYTTSGFHALRRPTTSSLFGVHATTILPVFGQADHSWAGLDLGNTNTAFTNNLALGKLTFDGGSNSQFNFFPVGASNALYVDYIELKNWATNFNTAFSISPNFTIYFANANVPASKLHNAAGGRFQWVRSFAGPLSSTNIYYESTSNYYTFNIALVTDSDIDSDGDGLVNSEDPEPMPIPVLSAAVDRFPTLRMVLSWGGVAYSKNALEYSTADAPGQWNLLTNIQMGPYNHPLSVADPIGTNGQMRVYRLRVNLD